MNKRYPVPCTHCGTIVLRYASVKKEHLSQIKRFCTKRCYLAWLEETFEERFWARVDQTPGHGPEGDCWLWTGAHMPREKYGHVSRNAQLIGTHQAAWELSHGPVSPGLLVLHRCDTPLCVRPEHLFTGTHKDNMQDMMQKARHYQGPSKVRGEDHPHAKMTWDKVRQLRQLHKEGATYAELGALFGIKPSSIYWIVSGKTWREDAAFVMHDRTITAMLQAREQLAGALQARFPGISRQMISLLAQNSGDILKIVHQYHDTLERL